MKLISTHEVIVQSNSYGGFEVLVQATEQSFFCFDIRAPYRGLEPESKKKILQMTIDELIKRKGEV